MFWKDAYKQKLTTAEDAVKLIKDGNRVLVTHAAGEPTLLTDAMSARAKELHNVEVVHMVAMGSCGYCSPEHLESFRHNSLFVGSGTRAAVSDGRADFTPVFFSEIPQLLQTRLKPDVTLLQLSPPDNEGFCSFGISIDYTKPGAEIAKINIAQINKNMPRTNGQTLIHVTKLHAIVEADTPLIELTPAKLGETELAIGRNVASLVRDGDTLQLGIGAIPDAVLASLSDKKDLGIYTEMFSDGVVDLAHKGVITNKRKNYLPGKFVATFVMGTRKLYDFVNNNPEVEMLPVDIVNDPRIACMNDNLVAINSCVQVDLLGQVVSDSIGLLQISGVGGQVDFVRAAAMSNGGRSVMAMPSVSKGGTSKIVPFIDQGSAVTTSRYDVDYVATEYGVAALKHRTLRERAIALIEISHPDFRESLRKEYSQRFKK